MDKKLLHTTKINIPEKKRIELIKMLNSSLACSNDLYAQLKQAHWNIKGPEFIAVHLLLDTIAEEIENQVDVIAERVTSLGGTALGTIQQTAKLTALRLYPTNIFAIKDHLAHLTHNIAILGELSRDNIKNAEKYDDMVTSDLYIKFTSILDKHLWLLEAHLQK